VTPIAVAPTVPSGEAVFGRVIDALGQPIDGRGPLSTDLHAPLRSAPPHPLTRQRIREPLDTGVRAIDGLLTIGRGQRIGLFAGAGVGKSTLLGMLARNVAADRVVVALIGERGREVNEFLEDNLRDGGRRAAVVVSTADQSPLLRLRAAYAATSIAEAARSRGEHVVLLMDSVTRFARALREVALASGESPGRQGFPSSVFSTLPQLFERAGNDDRGSITAIYTVLVAGDDFTEPIADETTSLLDGHIVLSRELQSDIRPAIDVLASVSRVMGQITDPEHRRGADGLRSALATWSANVDRIQMGLFKPPLEIDRRRADAYPRVKAFLNQKPDERAAFGDTIARLRAEFGSLA
jgi:FliI/YscN family ATPase